MDDREFALVSGRKRRLFRRVLFHFWPQRSRYTGILFLVCELPRSCSRPNSRAPAKRTSDILLPLAENLMSNSVACGSEAASPPQFAPVNRRRSTKGGSTCVVPHRYNNSREDKGQVSFHLFPSDKKLNKAWVAFVKRPESWKPGKWSVVCGNHFTGGRCTHDVTMPTIRPPPPQEVATLQPTIESAGVLHLHGRLSTRWSRLSRKMMLTAELWSPLVWKSFLLSKSLHCKITFALLWRRSPF